MPADIARPVHPAPFAEGEVYEAVRQFVLAYGLPALAPAHVVQGWQNRASLPAGSNDYAVISILYGTQRGTTLEQYSGEDERLDVLSLIELPVQVDICAEDDIARQRAQRIATVARSSIGVQFFREYGLSILYADDVRDLSFVGDAGQFVRRYTSTLRISLLEGVSVQLEGFERATLSRLEDVDVHHPLFKE